MMREVMPLSRTNAEYSGDHSSSTRVLDPSGQHAPRLENRLFSAGAGKVELLTRLSSS